MDLYRDSPKKSEPTVPRFVPGMSGISLNSESADLFREGEASNRENTTANTGEGGEEFMSEPGSDPTLAKSDLSSFETNSPDPFLPEIVTQEGVVVSTNGGDQKNVQLDMELLMSPSESVFGSVSPWSPALQRKDTFYGKTADLKLEEDPEVLRKKLKHHYKLRWTIIKEKYPVPWYCRRILLICAIIYCLMCACLIILYGMQFSMRNDYEVDFHQECDFRTYEDEINLEASEDYVEDQKTFYGIPVLSYPEDWSTTERWLCSVGLSLLEALFFINPFRIFALAFFKIFIYQTVVAFFIYLAERNMLSYFCCFKMTDAYITVRTIRSVSVESVNAYSPETFSYGDPGITFFIRHESDYQLAEAMQQQEIIQAKITRGGPLDTTKGGLLNMDKRGPHSLHL